MLNLTIKKYENIYFSKNDENGVRAEISKILMSLMKL